MVDKTAKASQRFEAVAKTLRKKTLETLTPWVLGPSSPTKLEKNLK
jgi:hypothetical protein